MKKILLVLAVLLLSSCGITPAYRHSLECSSGKQLEAYAISDGHMNPWTGWELDTGTWTWDDRLAYKMLLGEQCKVEITELTEDERAILRAEKQAH